MKVGLEKNDSEKISSENKRWGTSEVDEILI